MNAHISLFHQEKSKLNFDVDFDLVVPSSNSDSSSFVDSDVDSYTSHASNVDSDAIAYPNFDDYDSHDPVLPLPNSNVNDQPEVHEFFPFKNYSSLLLADIFYEANLSQSVINKIMKLQQNPLFNFQDVEFSTAKQLNSLIDQSHKFEVSSFFLRFF